MTMSVKFEDYQAKYEASVIPEEISMGLNSMRSGIHRIVSVIYDVYQQGPDVLIKTVQLGVTILSCIPSIDPSLEIPKKFSKEARNFTNFIKGLKSFDGTLHLTQFSCRLIILNISGMILFVLSSLTLIERYRLLDISTIKVKLASIPVFGILPYGGLLALSVLGLMSSVSLLSLDKKEKLENEANRIRNEKIAFWSQSFDLEKIKSIKKRYEDKMNKSQEEHATYKKLIQEGKIFESQLRTSNQIQRLYVCQRAIEEVTSIDEKHQKNIEKYGDKFSQWEKLTNNWELIDSDKIKEFREAKAGKWRAKLEKIECEKKMNYLSIAINLAIISRQVFALGGAVAGCGLVTMPLFINAILEAIISGGSVVNFFKKRSMQTNKDLFSEFRTCLKSLIVRFNLAIS